MKMRKAILVITAVITFSLPGTAFAEDWTPGDSSESEVEDYQPIPLPDLDDRDLERHQHLDRLYDDVERVTLPPIGIKPGHLPNPNFFELPTADKTAINPADTQYQMFQIGTSNNAKIQLNPTTSEPVQIKNLVLTKKTPSDEFLNGALAWGVGLGSAAFGLLALASMNSLRLRKKAKKA